MVVETAAEPGKSNPEIAPVRIVTVTERLTLPPPAPEQLSANVLVATSGPRDSVPEADLLPDHAPEAVQDVALVDDQLRVVDSLVLIVVGAALRESVGAGFVTDTVTERVALPPAPVQVSEYMTLLVSEPVD